MLFCNYPGLTIRWCLKGMCVSIGASSGSIKVYILILGQKAKIIYFLKCVLILQQLYYKKSKVKNVFYIGGNFLLYQGLLHVCKSKST